MVRGLKSVLKLSNSLSLRPPKKKGSSSILGINKKEQDCFKDLSGIFFIYFFFLFSSQIYEVSVIVESNVCSSSIHYQGIHIMGW